MTEDRRQKLLDKKRQIEAQLRALDARQRSQERKHDTRRKIIAGALALEHAGYDEAFAATLFRLIYRHVRRDQDRRLFGLDPLGGSEPEAANDETVRQAFAEAGWDKPESAS